ncbi:MAG: glycosyltransferase family 39 protein [Planctomycetota bacterium]
MGRLSAVFVSLLLLHILCLQSETYGDGITILWYVRETRLISHHLLYLPDLYLFTRPLVWLGLPERSAAFLFSAVCSSAGTAVLFHLLQSSRRLVPACRHPLLLAGLVALTPVLLYYGTQIENHAHHYFWVCLLLLVLDRALAAESVLGWSLAGLTLAAAYTSHSSSVLLMPALLVWIQWHRPPQLLRLPRAREIGFLLLFFLPPVLIRWIEPRIFALALDLDAEGSVDFTRQFVLGLLKLRSPETWARYLFQELFMPAFGIWIGALALIAARQVPRPNLILMGSALLPYVLVFGHWNVYERGAYYVALLPLAAVLLGMMKPQRTLATFLLVLVLGQGVYAAWSVLSFERRSTHSEEKWARDAASIVGEGGIVICWSAFRGLALTMNHGTRHIAIDKYHEIIKQQSTVDPGGVQRFADEKLVPIFEQAMAEGPLYISREGMESMERLYPVWAAKIRENFRLNPVRHGIFAGQRVTRK